MSGQMEYAVRSQPNRHRRENQDRVRVYIPGNPAVAIRKGSLFIVADGIGGQRAGGVASQVAVQSVLQSYYADPAPDPARGLQSALAIADGWLRYWASVQPDFQGMGTTLTAVAVRGRELYTAHAGDSRAYLVRRGSVWPLTRDHTWVASALARGILTPHEAASHPWRHVLTCHLGGRLQRIDVHRLIYAPGDRLVLCSDGVGDMVSTPEIGLLAMRPPRQAARGLVRLARRRGGTDDASAIVVTLGQLQRRMNVIQPVPGAALCSTPQAQVIGTASQRAFLLTLGLGMTGVVAVLALTALGH